MKVKQMALLAGTATLFSLSATNHAMMSLCDGWYADLGLGWVHEQGISNDGLTVKDVGVAGRVNIGYKFMPFVATELGYTYYGMQRFESGGQTILKNRPYDFHFDIKGMVPIANSGFEPYAKIGVVYSKTRYQIIDSAAVIATNANTTNRSHTGLYIGAGAQYYFMPELAGFAEWARAKGSSSSTGTLDLYSFGLLFIFG